jgi:uncharacterized protein
VERRVPVILDVSDLSKGKQRRFVGLFLETLYDLKNRQRDPLMVIIDEVPRFCPQQSRGADPDLNRCIGAVEDIVALGRSRGLGCAIIGQRPATINKNILTQADNLFAMRTVGTQDRKAIDEWVVEAQGDQEQRDELVRHIATLPLGEGYFWSPAIFGIFRRVKFAARATFDSSRTPKVGEKRVEPTSFAKVDLEALRGEIAQAVEKAKADDPRALRAQIAALQKQLRERPAVEIPKPEIIEVPVLAAGDADTLQAAAETMRGTADAIMAALGRVSAQRPQAAPPKPPVVAVRLSQASPAGRGVVSASPPGDLSLGKAHRSILTVLAQRGSQGLKEIAVRTGYALGGGGFNNALGALRTAGYIVKGDPTQITEAGIEALGEHEQLPAGPHLLDHWLARLGKAERAILVCVAGVHPRSLTKDEIAVATGYTAGGGGFNNALGRLRTLRLVEGKNEVKASDELL